MILQYKEKIKKSDWKNYPGKSKIKRNPEDYDFRLLSQDKTKILAEKGTYEKILKKMKQIGFFKHNKKVLLRQS